MSHYAIGDIQGCHASLLELIDEIEFDPQRDRLWLCGDLVNRGPDSLGALRWIHEHRRWRGVAGAKRRDTVDEVLHTPEGERLLEWLVGRPLLHRETIETREGPVEHVLVHAGVLPHWSIDEATSRAERGSDYLRGPDGVGVLERVAAGRDLLEPDDPRSPEAAAHTVQILTNLRVCDAEGRPHLRFNGPPDEAPSGLRPWYDFPSRVEDAAIFVCGHWAAQGLVRRPHLVALDSGCVWGGQLSAVRLEDGELFQVECENGHPEED